MGYILTDTCIADVTVLLLSVVGLLYWWSIANYDYWIKKKVKTASRITPFFGSLADPFLLRKQIGVYFQEMYHEFEGRDFGGYYKLRTPAILVRDPTLIKNVLTKDFQSFHDNDFHVNEKNDPMLAFNIFSIHGPRWKFLRSKLTPAFSTGRIRNMFPLMLEVCSELKNHLTEKAHSKNPEFEAKNFAGNFTTDVVGSCAFGFKCNSIKDENNQFRNMSKDLLVPSPLRGLMLMFVLFCPSIGDMFGFKLITDKIANFFRGLVKEAFEFREKNKITRNDFIQLLMDLKKRGEVSRDVDDSTKISDSTSTNEIDQTKIEFTDDVLTAQAVGFFMDGFETSSTTIAFLIHELAMNPEIQERLRQEIADVQSNHGGTLCFDAIQEMHFLDRIIQEVLRKYPPAMVITRLCTRKYKLPDCDITLDIGTPVAIPVYALHWDPKYFPHPEVFDPDRFTEENKKNITPYTYLPFGEGPRICIGMKFALAQVKACIATMVSNFEIQPTSATVHPVILDKNVFLACAQDGLPVKVVPLKK